MLTREAQTAQLARLRKRAALRMSRAVKDDPTGYVAARQDYHTARIAELITKQLSDGVPLRPEQVSALVAVVRGASPTDALADAATAA